MLGECTVRARLRVPCCFSHAHFAVSRQVLREYKNTVDSSERGEVQKRRGAVSKQNPLFYQVDGESRADPPAKIISPQGPHVIR